MFKDFFYFRKSDRRVITVLVIACIFVIGYLLGRGNGQQQEATNGSSDTTTAADGTQEQGIALRPFDPNTVDSASLISFGIKPWKVKNFIHYRAAGKVFRSPDDLLDTYGWEEADIAPLRPYITIGEEYQQQPEPRPQPVQRDRYHQPDGRQRHSANQYQEPMDTRPPFDTSHKFREHTLVDINTADTTLLQRIPGIGSHFSNSIVRQRERLGGYISIEQLFEIDNFPEETIDWFEVRDPHPRRIDINHADFRQLVHHPYISYDQARSLSSYIRLHGPFADTNQLRSTHIFTDDELERLTPYLEFKPL